MKLSVLSVQYAKFTAIAVATEPQGTGMNGKEFIAAAEHDAILVDALHRALYAMCLTNGCSITREGINGTLHFEKEIEKIRGALYLLGVDTTQPMPPPFPENRRR
jgi:hypothetical protein